MDINLTLQQQYKAPHILANITVFLLSRDILALLQALSRFEDLVHTCNDLLDNLVHANLASIRATCFLDLPAKQAFAVEDFLTAQMKAVKKHTDAVVVRPVFTFASCLIARIQ